MGRLSWTGVVPVPALLLMPVFEKVLELIVASEAVDYLVSRVEEIVAEVDQGAGADRKKVDKELTKTTNSLRRLVQLAQRTDEFDELIAEMEALRTKKAQLEEDLASLGRPQPRVTALRPAIVKYLENAAELLRNRPEQSRALLADLIEDGKFMPLGKGQAEVTFVLKRIGFEVRVLLCA